MLPPASPSPSTEPDLLEAFRILSPTADLLDLLHEGRGPAAAKAAADLRARFAAAEALLDKLPGADVTREAQITEARRLTAALEEKRALVRKYQTLPLLRECVEKEGGGGGEGGDGGGSKMGVGKANAVEDALYGASGAVGEGDMMEL